MNNKQHVQLTKVTDYDFVSAEKDKYGVFYYQHQLIVNHHDYKKPHICFSREGQIWGFL